MTVTENKIHQLIAQGENSAIEFKNAAVSPTDLAKEIVAFANTNGGVILIGVEDDGAISGISANLDTEEWVANIARNNVAPPILVETVKAAVKGKEILYIEIPKGKDKPYQTNQNRFLVRVGSTNRTATQHELLRLFQQSGAFHFDGTGVEGATIADLNFSNLDKYFSRYNIGFSQDSDKELLLKNTDILADNAAPTVGGLLVFGIHPQRFLRQAYITFAHFQGTTISDTLIDRQDIEGTLDQQIDTALAVIKNNIQNPSVIEGALTVSTSFLYPEKVYRELLTNACIHRNYAIHGSQIRVFLFDDRIEFHSPGKLPNTVTIEKITRGVSYAINPILLKFMQNLSYIDKLGRGIPMVWQTAQENGKEVVFEEIGEEFNVTLFF
jgi:ATP-dependent DNA helicase RecG